jgi:hypothetical protein
VGTSDTFCATHGIVTWTIPDPVPDSVYQSIQQAIDTGSPSVENNYQFYCHLVARHLLVNNHPATPMKVVNGQIVDWGDCGTPSNSVPTGGLTAVSDIQKGLGAAVGVSGAAVAALGGSAAASAAGLAALNAIPIAGTIAAAVLLPIQIIFAHHAAAVAREQGTICSCSQDINQWLDAIDQAVRTGQVVPADGMTMLHQLEQQYEQCVSAISAACSPGNVNAACDMKGVMRGQVLLRQWMYSNLPEFNPAVPAAAQTPQSSVPAGAVSAFGGSVSPGGGVSVSVGGNSLLWIILAIAAALLL